MIMIIDYGAGNLANVTNALNHLGIESAIVAEPERIYDAEKIILPGVGAFAPAMEQLKTSGLTDPICEKARTGTPFLGICLGMQMMLESSEEFGDSEGLGIIAGKVSPIEDTGADGQPHKIPHIGWNRLVATDESWEGTLLANSEEGDPVYFIHSMATVPESSASRLADTDYNGRRLAAVIRKGLCFGTQYHPEKSGPMGLRQLETFMTIR